MKKRKLIKENLIGKRFGRLTVIEKAPNTKKTNTKPNGRTTFLCKCDCGEETIVRTDRLKVGRTKSCGCLHNPYTPKEATARSVWSRRYKDGNLTFEQFMELSQQNCFYCNARPSNMQNKHRYYKRASKYAVDNGTFIYNGLDRIDSNLPHTLENCVPCCWACNSAKNDMTQSDFKKWVKRIYKYFGSK